MNSKLYKYHFVDLSKYCFLITGGAGFIGSNIVDYLVLHNAGKIKILDNLSTGSLDNLTSVLNLPNVEFINGDIRDVNTCLTAVQGVDYISHQAALGSVPRSISDPITTNDVNIGGFLNILTSAKEAKVKRMVYAGSSSTYGDSPKLPKQEDIIGNPLSPYAVTKYVNELYAKVYSSIYKFHTVGLRYFNVFGPRQNPNGQYAAVIPLFISSIINSSPPVINGDGLNSRDFTFVSNVVQANIKAMFSENIEEHTVLNIAAGGQTSLLELVQSINENLNLQIDPIFRSPRLGDVRHSFADITKAKNIINYEPEISFEQGIKQTISYFLGRKS
jgi:UDP-N-acetylglucosamine 4-epimerase